MIHIQRRSQSKGREREKNESFMNHKIFETFFTNTTIKYQLLHPKDEGCHHFILLNNCTYTGEGRKTPFRHRLSSETFNKVK